MSVCGWFSGGDRLDCCCLHAEQLHPTPPGHQELLYFFCKVDARGSHQEIRGGENSPRTLKKLPRTVLWAIGDSAKTSAGALVRFYLQNLRLMVFFDENEDFANWDLIGVAVLL